MIFSQCDLLIWEDTNYGLSHRLMLISLANNHIWESTSILTLFSHFFSVYVAYFHLSSENYLSYNSATKVVHVLTLSVKQKLTNHKKGSN